MSRRETPKPDWAGFPYDLIEQATRDGIAEGRRLEREHGVEVEILDWVWKAEDGVHTIQIINEKDTSRFPTKGRAILIPLEDTP